MLVEICTGLRYRRVNGVTGERIGITCYTRLPVLLLSAATNYSIGAHQLMLSLAVNRRVFQYRRCSTLADAQPHHTTVLV